MKLNFRTIGRLGLLFVVMGFFMPISCNMNGFQLAELQMNFNNYGTAILLYSVFLSALIGVIVGALLLSGKNVPIVADWITLLVSIGCGIYVFFEGFNIEVRELQSGAFVILIGWIISLIFLLLHGATSKEK